MWFVRGFLMLILIGLTMQYCDRRIHEWEQERLPPAAPRYEAPVPQRKSPYAQRHYRAMYPTTQMPLL